MEIISVIGAALICTILCVTLKQYKPEYAVIVSIAAAVLLVSGVIGDISEIIAQIKNILSISSVPTSYIYILLKCLGVCILTQFACEAAKDAGQSSIASKIELAGKIAVISISLPLFGEILSIVAELL